jgi:hypothetical protein
MPKSFVVWTDASGARDLSATATAYVIKDGNLPPIIGSRVHYGIHNTRGEIKAGIEGLKAVAEYCKELGIEPSECTVEMKTDFSHLKKIVYGDLTYRGDRDGEREKKRLVDQLNGQRRKFKEVSCDEIQRDTNIAHNICVTTMRNHQNIDSVNGLIVDFDRFYNQPTLCIPKAPSIK